MSSWWAGALLQAASASVQSIATSQNALPHAFANCPILKEVKITAAGTIGEGTFVNCSWLHTISMPKVSVIGHSAFRGAEKLEAVDAPKARQLENYSFADCGSSTRLTLPKVATIGARPSEQREAGIGCATIGRHAGIARFRGCSELKSLNPNCFTGGGRHVLQVRQARVVGGVCPVVAKPAQACHAVRGQAVPEHDRPRQNQPRRCADQITLRTPNAKVIGDFDIMIVNWPRPIRLASPIALPEPVVFIPASSTGRAADGRHGSWRRRRRSAKCNGFQREHAK